MYYLVIALVSAGACAWLFGCDDYGLSALAGATALICTVVGDRQPRGTTG